MTRGAEYGLMWCAIAAALGTATRLAVVHNLWIPLWATVIGIAACTLETWRFRWVTRRRHRRALRAFRQGRLSRWGRSVGDGL
jgi:hypothetical protein